MRLSAQIRRLLTAEDPYKRAMPPSDRDIRLTIPVTESASWDKERRTEFDVVYYSAINCLPTEFARKGYTLHPLLYQMPREIKLLVSVTISDTDDERVIDRTLNSIV